MSNSSPNALSSEALMRDRRLGRVLTGVGMIGANTYKRARADVRIAARAASGRNGRLSFAAVAALTLAPRLTTPEKELRALKAILLRAAAVKSAAAEVPAPQRLRHRPRRLLGAAAVQRS
jgi:hypothetical protein